MSIFSFSCIPGCARHQAIMGPGPGTWPQLWPVAGVQSPDLVIPLYHPDLTVNNTRPGQGAGETRIPSSHYYKYIPAQARSRSRLWFYKSTHFETRFKVYVQLKKNSKRCQLIIYRWSSSTWVFAATHASQPIYHTVSISDFVFFTFIKWINVNSR